MGNCEELMVEEGPVPLKSYCSHPEKKIIRVSMIRKTEERMETNGCV